MNTEIIGIIVTFLLTVILAIPLGRYIAKVYGERKTFLDPIFKPIDRFFYKFSGINPNIQMNWKFITYFTQHFG